ncbi:hypothetical protein KP509_12G016400 [Ceratopteris richardii]|uniref:Uncharacterized protein n=1 Tax=Ceratopteris richardii TaxID=49495 RepID=A0A8T2TLB4_CERRI|nr:hypothetical protein KP509_12G016400 [Ceratopteris richardii]KAH7422604.1 hypothetical protein KP509_12G016400 [Ceratopteris richardii]
MCSPSIDHGYSMLILIVEEISLEDRRDYLIIFLKYGSDLQAGDEEETQSYLLGPRVKGAVLCNEVHHAIIAFFCHYYYYFVNTTLVSVHVNECTVYLRNLRQWSDLAHPRHDESIISDDSFLYNIVIVSIAY